MGISERKQREKEDLKKQILEAAKTLFVEKGFESTSMRNIAELLEFSPTRLYIYYKDKNAIIYELHKEGFKLLSAQFQQLPQQDQPFERLKAIGHIYLQFAQNHPDFYEVMFVMKGPIVHIKQYSQHENWAEGTKVYETLLNTVTKCQEQGYFPGKEAHQISLLIWSTLHGISMLNLHQHLSCIDDGYQLADTTKNNAMEIFETFIKFIERTT